MQMKDFRPKEVTLNVKGPTASENYNPIQRFFTSALTNKIVAWFKTKQIHIKHGLKDRHVFGAHRRNIVTGPHNALCYMQMSEIAQMGST